MDRISVSRKFFKNPSNSNPILPNWFCADPAAIEYDGRLYVYGANDNQQYQAVGNFGQNTYEQIKSIVCFSTQDMINWTFHGCIDIARIYKWTLASWSPVVISRIEEDGLTHFYMYFSNSGCGVCVLTATNPLGPWTSPLGDKPLVDMRMKGIEELQNPFDPGACIDENCDGWLVFGGGYVDGGTDAYPGSARIVKLGKDLISLDSDFVEIKAPYFFESSRIDYINGYYIFSFNSNWVERTEWNYEAEKSTQCSINYMISKTPLNSDSWQYGGNYFKNPGDQGLNYSNNHSFFVKYKNQYYLFYHTLTLQEDMDTNGGFRSICVDKLEIDTDKCTGAPVIKMCKGTRLGLESGATDSYTDSYIDGFTAISGNTIHSCAEMIFQSDDDTDIENKLLHTNLNDLRIGAKSTGPGAWISVKGVSFSDGAKSVKINLRGKLSDISALKTGTETDLTKIMEIRMNKLSGPLIAAVSVEPDKVSSDTNSENESESDYKIEIIADLLEPVQGIHDLYFVMAQENIILDSWQLLKS